MLVLVLVSIQITNQWAVSTPPTLPVVTKYQCSLSLSLFLLFKIQHPRSRGLWSHVLFISCISYYAGEVVVVAITLRKQVEVCGRVVVHEHVCLHCSDPQSQPANIVSRLRWRKQ